MNSHNLKDKPINLELLDGAVPEHFDLLSQVERQKVIAVSQSYPLEERLEAYEDILESQVGDTTLTRARNLERETGLRQLYLKFEGGNPTGTQKDRIAFAQTMDAIRRGYDAITVATCGNYGAAIAIAAFLGGLHCRIYIPEHYQTDRVKEMTQFGADIIRVPGDYEAAVLMSQEKAEKEEIYDANPGSHNTPLQLRAYGEIAYEIYDELRDAPAAVAVPVSNGTTLAGIYKGFVSLYRRGKTSRIPKMIAGSSFGKNPIIQAFKKHLTQCQDLQPQKIRETKINEPLVNWHSIDGDLALNAVRETRGWASYASDKSMLAYAKMVRNKEGLSVLPASTAGLAVLLDKHNKDPFSGDRYVVIMTGRN